MSDPDAPARRRFPWLNVILATILLLIALVVFGPLLLPQRCIVEGMRVDTPAGLRPIQDLRPGDEVWSRTTDGSPKTGRVIRTLPARTWGFLRIKFSDGGVLCATGAHPIATPSGFLTAESLRPGMVVEGRDGLRTVASIEASSSLTRVYDLEIGPEPNFIAAGVLVHNKSSPERHAVVGLHTLATGNALFRSNDSDWNHVNDFWVGDVAGLYCLEKDGQPLKLIELGLASADVFPVTDLSKHAVPSEKGGYFYAVIPFQADGKPYDTGNHRSTSGFAFCAFPAKYSDWARYTHIVDETNTVYRKDIRDPKRILRWPKDLAAEGWTKYD